jgi:two-component system, chemotaxis family, CheB/CheR fusion protein
MTSPSQEEERSPKYSRLDPNFGVNLQLNLAQRIISTKVPMTLAENALAGARILLIDDTVDALKMLDALLTEEGAVVVTASSGHDALQIASEREFDLIISDISMPEMNGYEFLKELRKGESRYGSIPAIALTGFGRERDEEEARKAGFSTHLTKPIDLDAFLEAARTALTSNRER